MSTAASRLQEEQAWIKRARSGDQAAFALVVSAYQRPVYNLCYRMLGNVQEAEDATQETFIRAYTHLHRYDASRRFLNWILSIASNHCIDRLRRRRIQSASLEEAPYVETIPSGSISPQQTVERDEYSQEVQDWLDQLHPNYRIPIILLYWYEYSYEEIADILQLTVPAVKSRLHRARRQIADLVLADQEPARTATSSILTAGSPS